MQKTILLTGATDGIGLETAKQLFTLGHNVLLHGRNPKKLKQTVRSLTPLATGENIDTYVADLSRMSEVESLASAIIADHQQLDVLINNAGVFHTNQPQTDSGFDVRFAVNTVAPYLLTQRLLPLFDATGRVVNVSSAAQAPVDLKAFAGKSRLSDNDAYAQSKLALNMWSRSLALRLKKKGPVIVAVNPGSMLASKMVKEAFGVAGSPLSIGADILCRAALSDEFSQASGRYYDNDSGQFASPHRDALDSHKVSKTMNAIETYLAESSAC